MSARRRWLGWVIAAAAVLAALAVGIPFIYIHFIEGPPPAPLGLRGGSPAASGHTRPASTSSAGPVAGSVAGSWRGGVRSLVRHPGKESLLRQGNNAVGPTRAVARPI